MKRKVIGATKEGSDFIVGGVIKSEEGEQYDKVVTKILYCSMGEKREYVDIHTEDGYVLRVFNPDCVIFPDDSHEFKFEDNDVESSFMDLFSRDDIIGESMESVYEKYMEWCEDHEVRALPKFRIRALIKEGFGLDYGVKRVDQFSGKKIKAFID